MPDVLHVPLAALALLVLVTTELVRAEGGSTSVLRRFEAAAVVAAVAFAAVVVDRLAGGL